MVWQTPQKNCGKTGALDFVRRASWWTPSSMKKGSSSSGSRPSVLRSGSFSSSVKNLVDKLRASSLKSSSSTSEPSESQRRYEDLLADVVAAFPAASTVLLATRWGEVLARYPRESETARPDEPFDDSPFEDIPLALRREDDEMTAGDMEFQELVTGLAICVRLSRRYVLDALTPGRDPNPSTLEGPGISPAAHVPASPLFQTVGERYALFVYGVDASHVVAWLGDAADYAIDAADNDAAARPVVANLRVALAGAAQARLPPKPPRSRWGLPRRRSAPRTAGPPRPPPPP